MRKRWLATLVFGVPLVLIAGAVVFVKFESSTALDGLVPPEDIVWTANNRPAQVKLKREQTDEIESFNIEIQLEDASPYLITFEIDYDMFGGGFVGGLDLDGDGEIELVLATRAGPKVSRLVKLESGRVMEYSFDELSDDMWPPVKARLDSTVSPYAITLAIFGVLWLVLGLLIYLLIGAYTLFKRLTTQRSN